MQQNKNSWLLRLADIKQGYPDRDLPVWLWLYLPLLMVCLQILTATFLADDTYKLLMAGELGLVENVTVALVLGAAITGILLLRHCNNIPVAGFKLFIILFISGCIYIAGEETSWGQHYLQWETPDHLMEINKQRETNLHNIHNIFGRIPKTVLEWSIYLSAVFVFYRIRKAKPAYDPRRDWQYWYLPTYVIIFDAALAFFYRFIDRIEKWLDLDYLIDPDEMHECLIAIFLLLYILSIYRRLAGIDTSQVQ